MKRDEPSRDMTVRRPPCVRRKQPRPSSRPVDPGTEATRGASGEISRAASRAALQGASRNLPLGGLALGSLALVSLLILAACGGDRGSADLILTNAQVYTLDWGEPDAEGHPAPDAPFDSASGWRPDAEAVAMKDGLIVFVGDARGAEAFQGSRTRVMDLAGATVIPGLIESHAHVVELGALASRISLVGVEREEEAVRLAEARAAETPPGTWILGAGWDEGTWADHLPTMDLLSERVPDHPVYLRGLYGFGGWGNRMAFEKAGISASTPDPPGGRIERDAQGNPTGVVLDRAMLLLEEAVPEPSVEETMEHVSAGLRILAEYGYTAVHEAGAVPRSMAAFERLEAQGRLPLRVYAMLSTREPELSEKWLLKGPDSDTDSMLRTRSVKAFYDASLGSRGAHLLEDYSDLPGHRGVAGAEYGFDEDLVARMIRAGFQAEIHAIGDAGNREILDFFEGVLSETPEARDLRHKIVHAQVVHPNDFQRFADLGVAASVQPPHAVEDMRWAEDRLGPERIRGAYAWRTFRKNGVRILLNSDLPGSHWDFFYGFQSAVTRRDRDLQPPGGWRPEEALTPEEAVRGYTVWGAWAEFMDESTGILHPGFRGDLTVLSLDPFRLASTDPDRLLGGRILATIVGGEVVYEADR
jgi:predicted amidohydrolase YtcJ